jgi:L-ascorbate metabolism protein UlaG (beta-lactamase superfamily)
MFNTDEFLCSHACYLVEFPVPPGATRGVRIIFDPVFSNRCSPFQWLGPARFTGAQLAFTSLSCFLVYLALLMSFSSDPPCKIEDVPAVDAIVLSVSPVYSLIL